MVKGHHIIHILVIFFLDCGFIIPPQSHVSMCTRIESGVTVRGFPWLPSFLARGLEVRVKLSVGCERRSG